MAEKNANFQYLPYEPKMLPTGLDKLNVKRTALISLSFFIVLFAWSFFNFKVPLLLEDILGVHPLKDIIKGAIMAMDNLIAVFLQPYFGDLSDRTKSKYGRRMPFILLGTLASAAFFIIIPFMRALTGLILIVFLFDLAMSLYRSSAIAILPDYTPEKVYSKASAIQQFIANIGGLLAFMIPILIGGLESNLSPVLFDSLGFIIISVVMVIVVFILFVKFHETPTGDKFLQFTKNKITIDPLTFKAKEFTISEDKDKLNIITTYQESIRIFRTHKDFAYFLATVIFMYLAFASVESFFSSFATDYFDISEGLAGTLFLAYSGPMIAVAYFVGLLGQSKKVGRRKAVKIFLTWLIVSVAIFAFIIVPITYHNINLTFTFLLLILIAVPWMGFIVNSFPILWSLAPEGKVGLYTGIYYTFNQLAYTIAPIAMGGLLSVFTFLGDYRYVIMFPVILVLIIIALLFFFRVKGGEAKDE
jgi:maltose/moltooligosaccharide transporter